MEMDPHIPKNHAFRSISSSILILLTFVFTTYAQQDLPKEIRGYKVYADKIVVENISASPVQNPAADAFIKVGKPDLLDISLTGITLALSAEIKALEQSGKVDFLTFRDFKINGLQIEVEEYSTPFSFKKGEAIVLPTSAKLFLPTGNFLRGAWKEMRDSKAEWTVSGRVFVFGRFRKMGFNFKRVVPVDITLTIKNPMREADPINLANYGHSSFRLRF